jgi:O-antigen/teichoic acid export membrane protein
VVLGIAVFAPAFFTYLYDSRYHAAGWMTQLLMFRLWFYMLHEIASRTLLAVGDSRALALGNAVRLVATAAGCIAGYRLGGFSGLVLGVGAGALVGYLSLVVAAHRHGLSLLRDDLRYTAAGLACGLAGGLGPRLAAAAFEPLDATLLGLVLGAVAFAPVALFALHRVRDALSSSPAATG